jgi:hypothetical protein
MERFYSEQYSEQVLQLQNEVQHARAEVQFYEEQFKQMEAYRMQLAQYQQQVCLINLIWGIVYGHRFINAGLRL